MDTVMDPCYKRATNSAMVLCISTGQIRPRPLMAVQVSHIRLFLAAFMSTVASLFTENKLPPLPFLSHLSTSYFLIIVLHALNNAEASS